MSSYRTCTARILFVVATAMALLAAGDFFTTVLAEESCPPGSTNPEQDVTAQSQQRDVEAKEVKEIEETNETFNDKETNPPIDDSHRTTADTKVRRKPTHDWIIRKNPHTGEEEEIEVGVEQVLPPNYGSLDSDSQKAVDEIFKNAMDEVDEYMWSVYDDPELRPVMNRCRDREEDCLAWAIEGHCDSDRNYMWEACAPSCKACDMLIYERRCPYDPDSFRAWQPGDLNRMFSRIVEAPEYKKYKPVAWSQPTMTAAQRASNPRRQKDYPWVVSLENFLSDEEVERVLELAEDDGYIPSDDGGEYLEDGTFVTYLIEGRTSYNAWCSECNNDPLGQAVLTRIEEMTQIDRNHFEYLQMLRYERNQHYHVHHDYDYYTVPRQPGPRIATFFLYLSDVEEGGGTNFPRLNLTFTPKKGRAVIWPNVLDEDPMKWDKMTEHQALPVIKGTKYAANAWIHMHDWQGPEKHNCAE